MIISHKYKFLFIGLPFSASSAISKELHLEYEGEPLLRKHSLYHEFKKVATKEEQEYFVFAVLRNPMEIAITVYEKMKANAKGNFTNPKLFAENGGHITKKHRARFNFIHKNNASFQQYFLRFFTKPYDNLSSMTLDNCDFVIRYENIAEDYFSALKRAGIETPKPLPVANKTAGKKQDILGYYTDDIKKKAIFVFGPFMRKYNYAFPVSWGNVRISFFSRIFFKLISLFMRINQKYFKSYKNKIDRKGTVFGDIKNANKLS